MDWQLIETAPKKTQILVTGFGYKNGKLTKRRFYGQAIWSAAYQNFVDPWREEDSEEYVKLTHWTKIKPPVQTNA